MKLDDCFEDALRSADPVGSLRALAKARLASGEDHVAVVASFEKARSGLRLADRETDEDAVMDVLDFLLGFCSPHMQIAPAVAGTPAGTATPPEAASPASFDVPTNEVR